MRSSPEPTPPADAASAFGWRTFGALIFYSAGLLIFCGVVTMLNYAPVDRAQPTFAAAAPPHLPIAPIKLAGDAVMGPHTVCYQLAE